jgi:myo-inositol-1(or 4)-monophosphatase
MSADLQLIREAALAAGKLARQLQGQGLKTTWKPGNSGPVTNGDMAVDALLKERLLGARPDYGWLSEETADNPDRLGKQRLFIVDPIDGTLAYVKGKPWYTVCVAVIDGERPTAGVVFAPELDELYEAEAGGGARLNGAPITPTSRGELEACSILGDKKMFADPRWPTPWPEMQIESRNSIAYRMALVAAGKFDACFAPSGKHDWDVAAADLICTEAGALVTDHKGRGFRYNHPVPRQPALVCAGPCLHPLLIERVAHIQLPE